MSNLIPSNTLREQELSLLVDELEDELYETLHDLITITLKFKKLAALVPHIDPDDVIVDEGEVMEEFRRLDLAT